MYKTAKKTPAKTKRNRSSMGRSSVKMMPPEGVGSRSLVGPNQVMSRMRSSSSFSMGTSERTQAAIPISPGPAFYPKPTAKWLGDAPAYSFGGEYGDKPQLHQPGPEDAEQGTLTKEQAELLTKANATTSPPKRFQGADSIFSNPSPAQYKVHSQLGFGRSSKVKEQVLSKNRTGPRFSMASKACPTGGATVSPGPAAYNNGSTALGRQGNSKYRNHGGFGFGSEARAYQMPSKYNSPGPGTHLV